MRRGEFEGVGGQVAQMQDSAEDRRKRIRRMRDRGPEKLTLQMWRMGAEDPTGPFGEAMSGVVTTPAKQPFEQAKRALV